jgi:hypothetical protein
VFYLTEKGRQFQIMAGSDHELALEEALQRIGGEGNESDEDSMSVVSGYEGPDDEDRRSFNGPNRGGMFRTMSSQSAPVSISLKEILDNDRSFTSFGSPASFSASSSLQMTN